MTKSPSVLEVASQFVYKFVDCALPSKIQFKICYKKEFLRCKIHHMDKICLDLSTSEDFATAALQSVAKRCLSSHVHFF